MPPVAFSDLGSKAKDVLVGKATAAYQFNQVVSVESKNTDGVDVVLTAAKKDGALEMGIRSTITNPKYTVVGTLSQAGKLGIAATFKELGVPGLKLVATGTVPDGDFGKLKCPITGLPLPPVRLTADYVRDNLTLKSSVAVTCSPTVDVAATTGFDKVTVGGEASFDTGANAISKWTAGLGYAAADFQAALFLNSGNVLTAQYAHTVTPKATIGTEVAHNLSTKTTTFSAGVVKQLEGSALVKARLDNNGLVSLLYQQEVHAKTKMGLSAQVDALNLEKAPKLGFAYDLKY